MQRIKVMSVFGTRPEAIKMAPLVKELEKNERIESIVCVTAQHREMLDQVMELFDIEADYDLNIMKHGQTLGQITCRILEGIEDILKVARPDIVLVHGDTTTTFVTSLAAFYQGIKVGHVEAGLRSHDIYSPYPEEGNRLLTGRLANVHFAPTEGNRQNLLKEAINDSTIVVTGNTVIDALLSVVEEGYSFSEDILNQLDYVNKKVIVMTAHRRENLGEPMVNIFTAVKEVVEENKDVELVIPIHLNPKVREIAHGILDGTDRVHIIEPLDYKPMANLMSRAYMVMTDSGGLQEEAPALGKPVLVLRRETERPEAVEAGTVKIVGVDKQVIYDEANKLIRDDKAYERMSKAVNPYGDGKASARITKWIAESPLLGFTTP